MEKTDSSTIPVWHGHGRHVTSGNGKTASERTTRLFHRSADTHWPRESVGAAARVGEGARERGQEVCLPSHAGSAASSLCDT